MPKGITQEDVFGAADALLARGARPTIERVRREIGRGSPNTVNPLLDAWWESLSERVRGEGKSKHSIPAALEKAVEEVFEQLRDAAHAEANAGLDTTRAALAERESELSKREARLEAERAGLTQSIDTLQEELHAQRASNKTLTASERDLRKALSRSQAESRRLSGLVEKAEVERGRLSEAHAAEISRLQAHAEGQDSHWQREVDRLRQDFKQARASAAKERRQCTRLAKRLETAQTGEKTSRSDLRSLEKTLSREREARIRAEAKTTAAADLQKSLQKELRAAQSKRSKPAARRSRNTARKKSSQARKTRKTQQRKKANGARKRKDAMT